MKIIRFFVDVCIGRLCRVHITKSQNRKQIKMVPQTIDSVSAASPALALPLNGIPIVKNMVARLIRDFIGLEKTITMNECPDIKESCRESLCQSRSKENNLALNMNLCSLLLISYFFSNLTYS